MEEINGITQEVNIDTVTLVDCLELFKYKNTRVILNDGKIIGFEEE